MDISIEDLIKAEDTASSPTGIAGSQDSSESGNLPYWVGDAAGRSAGLRIDPQKNKVTLVRGDGNWYRESRADEIGDPGNDWKVTAHSPKMEVFMVNRKVQTKPAATVVTAVPQPYLRAYTADDLGPKIEGEELLKRIQGFGPSRK